MKLLCISFCFSDSIILSFRVDIFMVILFASFIYFIIIFSLFHNCTDTDCKIWNMTYNMPMMKAKWSEINDRKRPWKRLKFDGWKKFDSSSIIKNHLLLKLIPYILLNDRPFNSGMLVIKIKVTLLFKVKYTLLHFNYICLLHFFKVFCNRSLFQNIFCR